MGHAPFRGHDGPSQSLFKKIVYLRPPLKKKNTKMGKKKKRAKKKSIKKSKGKKSSAMLVLSVKTGRTWQKVLTQKLTNKKLSLIHI